MADNKRAQPWDVFSPNLIGQFWPGFGAAMKMMEPAIKAGTCINMELMSLSSRRARAYFETTTDISRCSTPQDLVAVQMRFWQAAMSEYTETGRRVVSALTSVGTAGLAAADSPERDYITFSEPADEDEPKTGAQSRQRERRAA